MLNKRKCPRLCSHLGTITTKIVQDGRLLCSSVLQGRNIACYNKPKLEFIKIEDCHWRRVTESITSTKGQVCVVDGPEGNLKSLSLESVPLRLDIEPAFLEQEVI